MSFLDKAKEKLTQAVDQHGEKISGGIDKAARMANEKTGGKHADKIDKATAKAREALDALDGKNDDLTDGGTRTAHGTPGTAPGAASTPPASGPSTSGPSTSGPSTSGPSTSAAPPPPPPETSATSSAPEAPKFGTQAPDPSAQPGLPTDPSNPATG